MEVHILATETYHIYATMSHQHANLEGDTTRHGHQIKGRGFISTSGRNDSIVTSAADDVLLSGKTLVRSLEPGRKSSWIASALLNNANEITAAVWAQDMEEGTMPLLQSSDVNREAFEHTHNEAVKIGMICVFAVLFCVVVALFCGGGL
ncbi:hypothetical protein AMS68_003594 [Peltaster fructicola]|uniref:Uncharacterized protein n=1 Tax=Peltaster fructicola TaxID=286661 RepID=A0A6H0XTI3_9PEZI|nr:hypothetical protein AMS68_003594 [Peltaster fructicola]